MRTILAFLLSILIATHASWGRPSCNNGQFWTNTNCNDPAIIVSGDVTDVIFSGANIQMTAAPSTPGIANISVQSTTAVNLGDIAVSGPNGVYVNLVLQGLNILNVGSVQKSANISLHLAGRVTGDLGSVVATSVGRHAGFNTLGLEIDGNLVGNMNLQDSTGASDVRMDNLIVRGFIQSDVMINTNSGGIGELFVDGIIGATEVMGVAVGTPANPVTITCGADISQIEAGEIHADIDVFMLDENELEVWGNIRRLRALIDTGGGPVNTGDFTGLINCNTIGEPLIRGFEEFENPQGLPQFEVQGDLGDGIVDRTILSFQSAIADHQGVPVIVVDGGFREASFIRLPDDGLQGQIIFNRSNTGAEWEWENVGFPAQIRTGTYTNQALLIRPDYGIAADNFGGGAAGLAAFQFHRQSCEPAIEPSYIPQSLLIVQGSLVWDPQSSELDCVFDNPSVNLQFYGPVGISAPTEDPAVVIELYTPQGWVDVSDDFVFETSPNGEEKRIAFHAVVSWIPGSYRISRDPGRLFSAGGVVGGPDKGRFRYYLDVVINPCENALLGSFDLNTDNNVTTPGDLPVLLAEQVDLNGDAAVTSADMTLLDAAASLHAQLAPQAIYYEGPWDDIELP